MPPLRSTLAGPALHRGSGQRRCAIPHAIPPRVTAGFFQVPRNAEVEEGQSARCPYGTRLLRVVALTGFEPVSAP